MVVDPNPLSPDDLKRRSYPANQGTYCRSYCPSHPELHGVIFDLIDELLAHFNRTMWIWGDRFLDGEVTGMGQWDAAKNGTAPAIHAVPKGIEICDWRHETAHPSAGYFALEGFRVLSSPWRRSAVALRQLDAIRLARMNSSPAVATFRELYRELRKQ